MQSSAEENPNAQVFVRAVKFSDGAQWHVGQPTPVASFTWDDLKAGGMTDMGKAVTLVAEQLTIPPMSERALPPVLVLVSDGQPTDDFKGAMRDLLDLPWGKRAVRIAVAIGEDADHQALKLFIANPEIPVLQANNAESLVHYIRWASTAVLKAASAPASQQASAAAAAANVPIPAAPAGAPGSVADVW